MIPESKAIETLDQVRRFSEWCVGVSLLGRLEADAHTQSSWYIFLIQKSGIKKNPLS
jgi:hypothetical protein